MVLFDERRRVNESRGGRDEETETNHDRARQSQLGDLSLQDRFVDGSSS